MPNIGRGTYEPPDDIHVFDGAEEDDDAEGSRLPLLIVIALFVLAAFAGVVWIAYTQGVARGRSDSPKVIAAQPGPARIAATGNEGGGSPLKGLKIYQQPAPSDEAADRQAAPPPSREAEAAQAPAAAAPAPLPPAQIVAAPRPSPTIKKPEATVPIRKEATTVPAETSPSEATSPPAQLSRRAQPAAAGAYVLQIGAYKSAEDADAAWRSYRSKHSALLADNAPEVVKVDLGEKGTWFRLRTGSFADKASAKSFCDKLAAEGGTCFPAK